MSDEIQAFPDEPGADEPVAVGGSVGSEDAREGINARLEKRTPEFHVR